VFSPLSLERVLAGTQTTNLASVPGSLNLLSKSRVAQEVRARSVTSALFGVWDLGFRV
jgi:hypothetical protein